MIKSLLLASLVILAHDPDTGDANWIWQNGYKGRDGVSCCGPTDCEWLDPRNVKVTPAGYFLVNFNETVPFSEATPTEDGRFWRCHSSDNQRRCFFAPMGAV